MQNQFEITVREINSLVCSNIFFDFYVFSYNREKLIVAGSSNLTYYHTVEIIFDDVFFVSGIFARLSIDCKSDMLLMPKKPYSLNVDFEIEEGYHLFILKAEDYKNNFVIAAKSISYNTDTVYYYERKDLKPNERIANFLETK